MTRARRSATARRLAGTGLLEPIGREAFDLFSAGKQVVVTIIPPAIVALAGLVLAADLGPGVIDSAEVVRGQVPAPGGELHVPVAVLDKDGDVLVHEVPADIVEVAGRSRGVDGQRDVLAAQRGTMFTEDATHGGIITKGGNRSHRSYPSYFLMKPSTQGSVRIISGEWRSRRIRIPPEDSTRPMLDRVKAAVFDMLGSYLGTPGRLPSLVVADVFSGGGTLGLEALSRGARVCVFVERDPMALSILRQNLRDLRVGPEGIIEPIDGWSPLSGNVLAEHGCGLILLDPPYRDLRENSRPDRLAGLLTDLGRLARWADPPVALLHHPADFLLDRETIGAWQIETARTYGTSGISLLSLRGAAAEGETDPEGPS